MATEFVKPLKRAGPPARLTGPEAVLRRDLAAAHRLVALYGWDDLIFTHLSVRLPGGDDRFLISPYGWMFEEITASSLVEIDARGERAEGRDGPVNPAGFAIHSAVHTAREDAQCVIHLHTLDGNAVAAQRDGLLPITQQATYVCGDLAYCDYLGPGHHGGEGARIAEALGDKHYLILRNHGLLTVGRTCADAFVRMYFLQQSCAMQVRAQAGRGMLSVPPLSTARQDEILDIFNGPLGSQCWPALLRKLERLDPYYQH